MLKNIFGMRRHTEKTQPAKGLDRNLVREIQQQTGLPDAEFQLLYIPVLVSLKRSLESLPNPPVVFTMERIGSDLVGMMRIRKGKVLPPGAQAEDIFKMSEAFTYAVFTGAIIRTMADIMSPFEFKADTVSLENVLCGVVPAGGLLRERHLAIPGFGFMMAGSVVPREGLQWLYENRAVFEAWCGYLGSVFANPLMDIEKSVRSAISQREDSDDGAEQAPTTETEEQSPGQGSTERACKPVPLGWQFVHRVKEAIKSGEIEFNHEDAPVWADWHGDTFLPYPRIFEWYAAQTGEEAKTVENRFYKLLIHEKGKGGSNYFWGEWPDGQKYKGIVIRDDSLLWHGLPPRSDFQLSGR